MNRFKTFLLLGLVTSLLVALGANLGKGWLIGCTIAAFALNLGAYFWSDRLVLRMQGAKELPELEAPGLHANVLHWGALLGGGSQSDEEGGGSPFGGLIFALLAPIGASLIQFAISRSREFMADASAAQVTGDPEGLALALERLGRLQEVAEPGPTAQPATASLMIASPFTSGGLLRWFSTHPPLEVRVARLRDHSRRPGLAA